MPNLTILTEQTAQQYFEYIFKLEQSGEFMPVNFDEVWPLVYAKKGNAVAALKNNKQFNNGIDYEVFLNTQKNPIGGRPEQEIKISVSCLEFFIVRKNRAVFECYRACRKAMQEAHARPRLSNTDRLEAESVFATTMRIGEMLRVPEHLLAQEAVKETKEQTGVDFSSVLRISPIVESITPIEEYLEPGDMGRRFNISAQKVNKLLNRYGYQEKVSDGWQSTERGSEYSTRHMWSRGSKSGYNYKWSVELFKTLISEEDAA